MYFAQKAFCSINDLQQLIDQYLDAEDTCKMILFFRCLNVNTIDYK